MRFSTLQGTPLAIHKDQNSSCTTEPACERRAVDLSGFNSADGTAGAETAHYSTPKSRTRVGVWFLLSAV